MRNIDKVLRFLLRKKAKLETCKLVGGLWGLYDFEEKIISIRKSLCEKTKVRVLVHECLHGLYPKKGERWVHAREKEIMKYLTQDECKKLARIVRKIKPYKEV